MRVISSMMRSVAMKITRIDRVARMDMRRDVFSPIRDITFVFLRIVLLRL